MFYFVILMIFVRRFKLCFIKFINKKFFYIYHLSMIKPFVFLILLTNIPPHRLTEGKKRIVYLSLPLSKFSADFRPYVQS